MMEEIYTDAQMQANQQTWYSSYISREMIFSTLTAVSSQLKKALNPRCSADVVHANREKCKAQSNAGYCKCNKHQSFDPFFIKVMIIKK